MFDFLRQFLVSFSALRFGAGGTVSFFSDRRVTVSGGNPFQLFDALLIFNAH